MKNIGIYTRLSKDDEQSSSIKHQLDEGKKFAKDNGFNPIIYNEGEGVSGTLPLSERPKLASLLIDMKEGKLKAVWFRNQNRLERNSKTFYQFMEVVIKYDNEVYFGNTKVDFDQPENKLLYSIMTAVNTFKPDLQSHQTKAVLKRRAENGKVQGRLPYGYTKDKEGYMIINETEAQIIERIFAIYLNGNGINLVADQLNDEGIPTRYNNYKGSLNIYDWGVDSEGKRYRKKDKDGNYTIVGKTKKSDMKWSAQTIHSILRNTIYKGERNYKNEVYECPAIIDERIFSNANLMMDTSTDAFINRC